MTLPEWVDPSSPDDPRAGGANEEGLPPPGTTDPVLATKPVLEWTHEDWARWVAGTTAAPATDTRPVAEEREPAAPPAAAASAAVERAEPAYSPAPDGDAGEWDEGPDTPIVDIRLPEEDGVGTAGVVNGAGVGDGDGDGDGDGAPPWWGPPLALLADEDEAAGAGPAITLGPDGWGEEVQEPAPERPWEEPADLAVVAPAAGEEAGEEAERPWEEPPDLAAAADDDRPWDDDEEFERRAKVWAEQHPPVPQGRIFGGAGAAAGAGAPAGEVETAVEAPIDRSASAAGPALSPAPLEATGELAPPPLEWPPEKVAPPLRHEPTRARPAVATRPAPAGPVLDEEPHRLRSAMGLLMLAVTLGVILAALVTAAVLGIGFALRQLSA